MANSRLENFTRVKISGTRVKWAAIFPPLHRGPFIKYVINQGGFAKKHFAFESYLVKVLTKGDGATNLKKLLVSFM